MSYRDSENRSDNGGVKKIGAILLGLVAFGIAKTVTRTGIDFARQKTVTAASIESRAESNETTAPTMAAMKQYFPVEYHEWSGRTAEMIRNGATENDIFAYSFGFSRDLVKSHLREIRAAPDSTLVLIAQQTSKVAQALAGESKSACAEFGFEGLQPQTAQQLSKSTISLVGSATPLMLEAASEGARHPVQRPAQLTIFEAKTLMAALKNQGLSSSEINDLLDGKAEQEDVLTKCRLTTALYGAVAQSPSQASAHLTAAFLS